MTTSRPLLSLTFVSFSPEDCNTARGGWAAGFCVGAFLGGGVVLFLPPGRFNGAMRGCVAGFFGGSLLFVGAFLVGRLVLSLFSGPPRFCASNIGIPDELFTQGPQ